ncbi:MAG: Arylesterase precursor [Rhizobium sp.]|nr:Arylesterase precursor [Rhizobium sp.]
MTFKALAGAIIAVASLFLSVAGAGAQTISVVGFGDSLMAGYELPPEEAFPAQLEKLLKDKGHDIAVTNAGVSGDTTADGLARIDWSIPDGTQGVILEFGANDALRGLSPKESRDNLEAMIARLKERKIPVLLVGILAPPNMGGDYETQFNAIYPDLAKKYGLPLYPFFLDGVVLQANLQLDDGMHPNGDGTRIMAEKFLSIAETFVKMIKM